MPVTWGTCQFRRCSTPEYMHWVKMYESTSLWSVQINNMKQLKCCALFCFNADAGDVDGIVLVFMNVKFVCGFAISIAIFNTWRRFILLFCVVLCSVLSFSFSHSVHLSLVVVKQSSFGFLTCSIVWLMWLAPRSQHCSRLGMDEHRERAEGDPFAYILFLIFIFICIIFSISHSHPSSSVSHFRITSMAFLFFFSIFYSNYIFTALYRRLFAHSPARPVCVCVCAW